MSDRKSPWGTPDDSGRDESGPDNGAQPENASPASEGNDEADTGSTPDDAGKDAGKDRDGKTPPASAPRNPWLPPAGDSRRPPSIEDIFRARTGAGKGGTGKNGSRSGGNGRGGPPPGAPFLGGRGPNLRLPQRPDGKSWWPIGLAAIAAIWLIGSSTHRLAPQEQGVVTTFGAYSRTLGPGVSLTLPWPIQSVETRDVTSIQRETIPEGDGERLMLTGDQNLVNLNYLVRWNIKDLKLYTFQLADPDQTVREVAEAAMRAAIAEVGFNDAMGTGRAAIEQNVRDKMQRVLDAYRSGVKIQGVEITKIDPPAKVVDAFKEVLAAQQKAQGDVNEAQGWAQKKLAAAQGEAAAFDKVYEQYKLAPEVTKRRMYYETMERVLSQTDKVVVEAPGTVPYLPLPALRQTPPDDSRQKGDR